MALSVTMPSTLGYQNKFTKSSSNSILFLGKKVFSNSYHTNNNYKNNVKKSLNCKAILDNSVTPLLDALVASSKSGSTPQVPLDGGSSTISVPFAPGLEPATITIPDHVKRSDFPPDFLFGASSSAIQTEGNGKQGARAASTWDFMISLPGGNAMGTDSYSLFKEDVKLLKDMGMTAYRFSISWSRILPYAGVDNSIVNQHGIDFYNNLINELIANGITPFVTLFHFDLPVTVQNKYSGFLSEDIIDDFKTYADVCFKNFGDRVKNWITMNEPYNFGSFGYTTGLPANNQIPPSPFVATHNIILSHAAAVQHYRDFYKKDQGGKIGISLSSLWFEPYDQNNEVDKAAQVASLATMLGWYMNPLVYGEYPTIMEKIVIGGLPKFTPEQKKMVQGSFDFIGINYYTSRYVTPTQVTTMDSTLLTLTRTEYIEQTVKNKEGNLIGPPAPQSTSIYVVPTGLRELLLYIKRVYKNPEVYVTENGVPSTPIITDSIRNLAASKNVVELKEALLDEYRIKDIGEHLYNLREALADITHDEDGQAVITNVKGYFVWALTDNMEVGSGYNIRYGLNYVDYRDRHTRYRKASSYWFSHFLRNDPNNNAK